MLANYDDVVPRREFEMLKTSFTACYMYYIKSYNKLLLLQTLEGEADSIKTIAEEHKLVM